MVYVMDDTVYSPQNFVCAATGNCYVFNTDDDFERIQELLKQNGIEVWDFPLGEIDHIVENKLQVVLVEGMIYNGEEFEHKLRWFEVPDGFCFP